MTETPVTAMPFLQQLRTNTSASHTRLELLPISQSIISPQLTGFQYASYLALMRDIVHDVETAVFPVVSGFIADVDQRRKLSSIQADLDEIGFDRPLQTTPLRKEFSVPFALGVLYVVEGSSLGGRVILKNVEAVLGFDSTRGAQYFSGYGATTGSHWKKFIEMLTSYQAEQGHTEEIIAGAIFAFDTIYEHLSSFRHED